MRILIIGSILMLFSGCSKLISEENSPNSAVIPAPLFRDHVVLQRDAELPVWGKAPAGTEITVKLNSQTVSGHSDPDGNWFVTLAPEEAGGPYKMVINGPEKLILKDVWVGEVWLASGQSNMEMPVGGWGKIHNYKQIISETNLPEIRFFNVRRKMSLSPDWNLDSNGWQLCRSGRVAEFSAAAFYFARELHEHTGHAIGIISSSWGGTVIETWMGEDALAGFSEYEDELAGIRNYRDRILAGNQALSGKALFKTIQKEWVQEVLDRDRGYHSGEQPWYSPETDISDWPDIFVPSVWESAGYPDLDGVGWYQKELYLSREWIDKNLILNLNTIDDIDSTWFNGIFIGSRDDWDQPRSYSISHKIPVFGRNVITIRVQDNQGNGGIWGDPTLIELSAGKANRLSLAGLWKFRVGVAWNEITTPSMTSRNPNYPTLLSNGMIQPLIPFAIRGVVWYQGESNTSRACQYDDLFAAMIHDWRKRWGMGDFPFLFVQLANFKSKQPTPIESDWAELRDAQLKTLQIPNTGMAVTIDIGDEHDIHPKNKQEVGRRLSLLALRDVYNADVVKCGPVFRSMSLDGSQVHLRFDHADSLGVAQSDSVLKGFSIAGDDGIFQWAEAEIRDSLVIVWHPSVLDPKDVRYGWADNPECNLVNEAGLPASPFRTDKRPGITCRN